MMVGAIYLYNTDWEGKRKLLRLQCVLICFMPWMVLAVTTVHGRPAISMANQRGSGATGATDTPFAGKASRLGVNAPAEGVHISMEAYTTTDHRQSPLGKEYDSDIDEESESDLQAATVKYTHSERAQITLPEAPRVNFTHDLTSKRAASPANEKY